MIFWAIFCKITRKFLINIHKNISLCIYIVDKLVILYSSVCDNSDLRYFFCFICIFYDRWRDVRIILLYKWIINRWMNKTNKLFKNNKRHETVQWFPAKVTQIRFFFFLEFCFIFCLFFFTSVFMFVLSEYFSFDYKIPNRISGFYIREIMYKYVIHESKILLSFNMIYYIYFFSI